VVVLGAAIIMALPTPTWKESFKDFPRPSETSVV
jgi:hypothetical protein